MDEQSKKYEHVLEIRESCSKF